MSRLVDYLRLVKFSHTIFAMPFALLSFTYAWSTAAPSSPLWLLLLQVVGCMVFARNVAMGFNRWAVVPKGVPMFDEYGNPMLDWDGNPMLQFEYSLENDIHRLENGEKSSVKPVLNFGVGFEYLITKQFTAFAQINNIGCQYATNYYGFNNFGINAIVGITYSFGNEAIKPLKKKTTKTVTPAF